MRRGSKADRDDIEHTGLTQDAIKERLLAGKSILYHLKYEGSFLVNDCRGLEPVKSAFKELRRTKEERRKHGIRHTPIKNFFITLNSVSIQDPGSKEEELGYAIRSISYIINDEKNRNYIGMIAQVHGKQQFECTILKHDEGRGREIVHTLGMAFDLAYDENMKNKNVTKKNGSHSETPVSSPSAIISAPEHKMEETIATDDVSILKTRLRDLAVMVPEEKLKWYLSKHDISEITELPKRVVEDKTSNNSEKLIHTDEKTLPSVGTKLENLLWNDVLETETQSEQRRRSASVKVVKEDTPEEEMIKKQEEIILRRKISEGGIPFPKVNPPPRVVAKRRQRAESALSLDDPFDMGDFNAVSFPEFDDFYTNLNETDKAQIDLLA